MSNKKRSTYVLVQMALLMLCAWFAVRQATRPLEQLAAAADALDPNQPGPALNETGPSEVAHAAAAFNAMRGRIAHSIHNITGLNAAVRLAEPHSLPRSEGKAKRVWDERQDSQ